MRPYSLVWEWISPAKRRRVPRRKEVRALKTLRLREASVCSGAMLCSLMPTFCVMMSGGPGLHGLWGAPGAGGSFVSICNVIKR